MSAVHDALKGKHRREDATPSGGTVPPPLLADAALYGPLGDYVRTVAPHTETASAGILSCALATLGTLIGRGPTWRFGDAEHHARFFVLLVGPSSAGRKGGAIHWGVSRILEGLDIDFHRKRRVSGLSSAEGLIAEVRDAVPESVDPVTGKVRPGDPGELDKRLLVVETEFGGTLDAIAREGNRLSAVLRDTWDGIDLRTLTKREPQRCTAPHVGIVAAITPHELSSKLKKVSVYNGLANRFLPVWNVRARLIPHDSTPDAGALDLALRTLARGVVDARRIGFVRWTPAAADAWAEMYESLVVLREAHETVATLLSRGAPYVRRTAMLYALLDGTGDVDVPHLEAARALWDYAAGTWRALYASGSALSGLAEKFLEAIEGAGADGCTRTDLRDLAGGNTPKEAIESALHELAMAGLAQRERVPTAGRPREVWRHARHVGAALSLSTLSPLSSLPSYLPDAA